MNGNVSAKIIRTGEPQCDAGQIASLKERMTAAQEQLCLLLDETAELGLKWHFNLTQENGRHKCVHVLLREY